MSTQEFYVRRVTDADARGPFTIEQLVSLADTGQVDPDTLYYDAATEQWVIISQNPTLHSQLFPQKRSLTVRPKAVVSTLNTFSESDRGINVQDMLAAAEGRTPETRGAADPAINQARASVIGMYGAMAILLVLGAAFVLPHLEKVLGVMSAPVELLREPIALLGVLSLILGMCLALGATGAYAFVRFSAMLILGYNGALFYLAGQNQLVGASVAASVGLYFCTVFTNIAACALSLAIGLGGALLLAVHFFTT
jgi:hypothetical protein